MGIRIGFVFAALALGLSAAASPAVTVTVGGNVWDVSTITGSFAELEDTLIGQAWWGDGGLAYDLAEALGSQLDFPNNFDLDGPYFAFLFFEGQDVYARALTGLDLPGDFGVNDAVLLSGRVRPE